MNYCKQCGKKISENARDCPKCGEPQKQSNPKSKTTAIVLAAIFSHWTWCYTYKKDAWKFWLNLVANIFFWWTWIVPIGTWIWAMIDSCSRDQDWYERY